MQLFCFTHAGGNADFFCQLESWLKPGIDLEKLEYAGHGARYKEICYANFSELSEDMYRLIKQIYKANEGYALMGYSMGTISAVEVLRRILRDSEMPRPKHIFLAAHEPHTKKELLDFSVNKSDDWIKDRTIKFGGVPDKLIDNRSFWRMYLPLYRADYALIGSYDFDSLRLACNIPTTVFYSETDTRLEEMERWKQYFVGRCKFIEYKGNHFFITEHCREISEVIKMCLMSPDESD